MFIRQIKRENYSEQQRIMKIRICFFFFRVFCFARIWWLVGILFVLIFQKRHLELTDGRNRTQCLLNAENGLHRSSGVLLTCVASALLVSCVR